MYNTIRLMLGLSLLSCLLLLPWLTAAQTATPTPAPTATPVARPNLIFGETLTESFMDLPTSVTYQFEGETGQFVNVLLEIERFYDTRFNLYAPDGYLLRAGNFNPTSTGLDIQGVRLPYSGLYIVTVENQVGLGSYTLRLQQPAYYRIEAGQVTEGQLDPSAYSVLYRLSPFTAGWYDLSLTSTAFDAYLSLFDADLNEFIRDDDSGAERNAFIGPQYLYADRDYFILVRGKDDLSTGAFQLVVNSAQFTSVAYDELRMVTFTEDEPVAYYDFQGSIGDIITIQVDSAGTIDTLFNVTTPDTNFLPFDDDSGNGFDPELGPWLLTHSGHYGILLRPYTIGSTGQVSLTVSRQPLLSLDDEVQTIDLTNKQRVTALTFTGKAGEQVRLIARIDPLMTTPPTLNFSQNAQPLLPLTSRDGFTLFYEFLVPDDGTVVVQVTQWEILTGLVQLSLERLPS